MRNHLNYGNPYAQPFLRILEQPMERGFRFRYKSEAGAHGGLPAESSQRNNKKYPTIKIENYVGPARIEVTLMTNEPEPRVHVHELVGKNCEDGVCHVRVMPENEMIVCFQNLGILHLPKKEVPQVLYDRLEEEYKIQKMMTQRQNHQELTEVESQMIRQKSEDNAKTMELNVIRLCFQAYVIDEQGNEIPIPPVLSNPVFDSKSPNTAALKICRMDKQAGFCVGNEEIFLLCDRVQKDDISIRFFELDENGKEIWQDYGTFSIHDVHKQYAIVFKTPAFRNKSLSKPVRVFLQLQKKKDGLTSEPKSFTFKPLPYVDEKVGMKRQKITLTMNDLEILNDAWQMLENGNEQQHTHGSVIVSGQNVDRTKRNNGPGTYYNNGNLDNNNDNKGDGNENEVPNSTTTPELEGSLTGQHAISAGSLNGSTLGGISNSSVDNYHQHRRHHMNQHESNPILNENAFKSLEKRFSNNSPFSPSSFHGRPESNKQFNNDPHNGPNNEDYKNRIIKQGYRYFLSKSDCDRIKIQGNSETTSEARGDKIRHNTVNMGGDNFDDMVRYLGNSNQNPLDIISQTSPTKSPHQPNLPGIGNPNILPVVVDKFNYLKHDPRYMDCLAYTGQVEVSCNFGRNGSSSSLNPYCQSSTTENKDTNGIDGRSWETDTYHRHLQQNYNTYNNAQQSSNSPTLASKIHSHHNSYVSNTKPTHREYSVIERSPLRDNRYPNFALHHLKHDSITDSDKTSTYSDIECGQGESYGEENFRQSSRNLIGTDPDYHQDQQLHNLLEVSNTRKISDATQKTDSTSNGRDCGSVASESSLNVEPSSNSEDNGYHRSSSRPSCFHGLTDIEEERISPHSYENGAHIVSNSTYLNYPSHTCIQSPNQYKAHRQLNYNENNNLQASNSETPVLIARGHTVDEPGPVKNSLKDVIDKFSKINMASDQSIQQYEVSNRLKMLDQTVQEFNNDNCSNDSGFEDRKPLMTQSYKVYGSDLHRNLCQSATTGSFIPFLSMFQRYFAIPDQHGNTPLHIALIHENEAMADEVYTILIQGKDKSIRNYILSHYNNEQKTPLHLMAQKDCAKLLHIVSISANPNYALLDGDGNTIFHISAKSGALNVISWIKMVTTNEPTVKQMGQTNINLLKLINDTNYEGQTAIHLATLHSDIEVFQLLLSFPSVDLNKGLGKCGKTCLHLCVERLNIKYITMLLAKDECDVNTKDFSGATALDIALKINTDLDNPNTNEPSQTIIDLLKKAGCLCGKNQNSSHKDFDDQTPGPSDLSDCEDTVISN